jgi:hypothetical protein
MLIESANLRAGHAIDAFRTKLDACKVASSKMSGHADPSLHFVRDQHIWYRIDAVRLVSVVRTFGAIGCLNYRSVGLFDLLMLGGEFAVWQAPLFDCLSFDPFSLFDDGLCSPEVGIH